MTEKVLRAIGILAGTGLYDLPGIGGCWETMSTEYGSVELFRGSSGPLTIIFVPRHGRKHSIPPHMVTFKANIAALQNAGSEAVVGVNSVGSLRPEIEPGSIVIPDDYISLYRIDTFHDNEVVHITPALDDDLRQAILTAGRTLGIPMVDGGVYFQTLGPRLETRAEIGMIAQHAHVVGMNMGSEAALCQEAGLRFANISSVDNYAHGLGSKPLDFKEIIELSKHNQEKTKRILSKLLGGGGAE